MPLLREGTLDPSPWALHTTDTQAEAYRFVSLSEYLQQPEPWHQLDEPWFAVAQPEDDLSSLPSELLEQPLLGIAFPKFTDGRGYSQARYLRHYHGYTGELIATGDIRRDQIDFMARVGIDSFECSTDVNLNDWHKALTELPASKIDMHISTPIRTAEHPSANTQLAENSAEQIIEWSLAHAKKPLLTTSFGPQAGVLLHAVLTIDPTVPVLWVDHGFNTHATYRFAKQLIKRFNPKLHIYSPRLSSAWILSQLGGMPELDDPKHADFSRQVKLEPFDRALQELQPDLWLTGIRQDETAHRRSLSVVSEGRPNLTRVAPFFHYSEEQIQAYLREHTVPTESNYFDPTKVSADRECGLHAPS